MKLLMPTIDIFYGWYAHWYVKYQCKQIAFFCVRKDVTQVSIPMLVYSRLYEELVEALHWRKMHGKDVGKNMGLYFWHIVQKHQSAWTFSVQVFSLSTVQECWDI